MAAFSPTTCARATTRRTRSRRPPAGRTRRPCPPGGVRRGGQGGGRPGERGGAGEWTHGIAEAVGGSPRTPRATAYAKSGPPIGGPLSRCWDQLLFVPLPDRTGMLSRMSERFVALGLGGVLDALLVLRGRQDRDVLDGDRDDADERAHVGLRGQADAGLVERALDGHLRAHAAVGRRVAERLRGAVAADGRRATVIADRQSLGGGRGRGSGDRSGDSRGCPQLLHVHSLRKADSCSGSCMIINWADRPRVAGHAPFGQHAGRSPVTRHASGLL